jgi:hypothetical protein
VYLPHRERKELRFRKVLIIRAKVVSIGPWSNGDKERYQWPDQKALVRCTSHEDFGSVVLPNIMKR